ncbi:MAG: L,D-transpeptidase [Myxococcota bacterium]
MPVGPSGEAPGSDDSIVEALQDTRRTAQREFEARYPKQGVTRHFLARVRVQPSVSAPVAGYMRRGARFRATERVPGVGCRHGWFEVPGAGFVCRGEAYAIGDEAPQYDGAPHPPALEDPLPYHYARVRQRDIGQFWRLPSLADEARFADIVEALAPSRRRVEAEVDAPPAPGAEEVAEARAPRDSVALPDFVRQRMRPGFYVSLNGEESREDGRRFARTLRGGFLRADALEAPTPSSDHGVVLGGAFRLPVAFTRRDGTHRLRRRGTTRHFASAGTVDRHQPLAVARMMDRSGQSYIVDSEGYTVRRSAVRIAAAVERPSRVREGSRWIHVSLAEQTLVAYEDDTPVYATLVSTGREGFETPAGLFRIQSKHVSTTMDDLTDEDSAYQIEDVPWTMYFEGNYALHTAFWHRRFGTPRSHGCVNLAPADARWVFHWAGPELPASWHGVFADRHRAGSWVYITEE